MRIDDGRPSAEFNGSTAQRLNGSTAEVWIISFLCLASLGAAYLSVRHMVSDKPPVSVTVSRNSQIELDRETEPEFFAEVKNLTEQSIELFAINLDLGCRADAVCETVPCLIAPNETASCKCTLQVNPELMLPANLRSKTQEIAMRVRVRDSKKRERELPPSFITCAYHRTVIASARRIDLTGEVGEPVCDVVERTLLIELDSNAIFDSFDIQPPVANLDVTKEGSISGTKLRFVYRPDARSHQSEANLSVVAKCLDGSRRRLTVPIDFRRVEDLADSTGANP